ncbi:hypothetical protein CDEST_15006 [Colletotrichum destructivum]|uniref:Zn(2)-C6 fungal-type domain-containing protein n=1 Tax=Colletotrichum destructivum TaxID=34406 RepID=A0AAX4J375_9PEZI|nr:hypothetical protein CDEST_15006 [Colletotrichum destructivum]
MSSTVLPHDPVTKTPRQYRSRKRQRPCDRCRSMKLKCQQEENQMACRRCKQSQLDCTFTGKPRKRTPAKPLNRPEAWREASPPTTGRTDLSFPTRASRSAASPTEKTPVPAAQHPLEPNQTAREPFSEALETNTPFAGLPQARPATQISQSLDQMRGCSAMLLGGSSGLDPWLLRHLRFDELGLQSFYKYHVRNAGGVPTFDKIPVHFILTSDEVAAEASVEVPGSETRDLRRQLELLIPPFVGVRLMRLFHQHVFPTLPVVSRKCLGLTSMEKLPEVETLNSIPTHLLAAVYGSALPFTSADEHLVVPLMHERVPCGEVWRIAQKSFLQDLQRPHLSVLQAMLLYLHRTKEDSKQYAATDTAALWPLMGTMVGLAHNLGLHLECRMMGIPAYEKRLRRRLWWAVYIEDKFFSLLGGRPPYIQQGEWDVSQLDSADFVLRSEVEHPLPWHRMPFVHMANLALIADSLQRSLYSLQSCQKLAEDLTGSIQAARTAFDALNIWRANIPGLEHILEETNVTKPALDNDPSSVQFAYLILVTYVWRAVLRPTVRSQPPPPIIDVDQEEQPAEGTSLSLEDFSWEIGDLCDISLDLGDGGVEVHDATIIELYQGALAWAKCLVGFVFKLSSRQMGEFWHSWSQLSFVAASSFIVMLVVQAPSPDGARRSKDILDNWRRLLRDQSRAFPILGLSFSQLSEFYRVGLSTAFCLPLHVQEAIEGGNNG